MSTNLLRDFCRGSLELLGVWYNDTYGDKDISKTGYHTRIAVDLSGNQSSVEESIYENGKIVFRYSQVSDTDNKKPFSWTLTEYGPNSNLNKKNMTNYKTGYDTFWAANRHFLYRGNSTHEDNLIYEPVYDGDTFGKKDSPLNGQTLLSQRDRLIENLFQEHIHTPEMPSLDYFNRRRKILDSSSLVEGLLDKEKRVRAKAENGTFSFIQINGRSKREVSFESYRKLKSNPIFSKPIVPFVR